MNPYKKSSSNLLVVACPFVLLYFCSTSYRKHFIHFVVNLVDKNYLGLLRDWKPEHINDQYSFCT